MLFRRTGGKRSRREDIRFPRMYAGGVLPRAESSTRPCRARRSARDGLSAQEHAFRACCPAGTFRPIRSCGRGASSGTLSAGYLRRAGITRCLSGQVLPPPYRRRRKSALSARPLHPVPSRGAAGAQTGRNLVRPDFSGDKERPRAFPEGRREALLFHRRCAGGVLQQPYAGGGGRASGLPAAEGCPTGP